jgi:hypothetical protein
MQRSEAAGAAHVFGMSSEAVILRSDATKDLCEIALFAVRKPGSSSLRSSE